MKRTDSNDSGQPAYPDLVPRHRSWAQISTRNSLIGAAIFLGFILLLYLAVEHGGAATGVLAVVAFVALTVGAFSVIGLIFKPAQKTALTTNQKLEQSVREALDADPRVNANLVLVRIENGIAYLTGRQETVDARDAATEIVAHIPDSKLSPTISRSCPAFDRDLSTASKAPT
ncbi:MAG: BON domain-containing protein [Armatimonadetes bacterium]|nr:BON domain-containing protein [Armatimonadota bacterium]